MSSQITLEWIRQDEVEYKYKTLMYFSAVIPSKNRKFLY